MRALSPRTSFVFIDALDPKSAIRIIRYLCYDILQIVAVILCSTGVALLAYMDAGITNKKKTMTGVLLAALAAAGSAVYKVSLE